MRRYRIKKVWHWDRWHYKPQIRTWLVFWSCFGDDYGDVACWTIVEAEDWIRTHELDRRRRQYMSWEDKFQKDVA